MKRGLIDIAHEQEYATITCEGCKREFILLSVHRSGEKTGAVIEQNECDYCPFCGRDAHATSDNPEDWRKS